MKHEEEKRTHEEEIKRREEEKLKENCINMYSQLKNGLEQYTDVSSYKIKAFQVFEDKIVDRERGTIYFHAIDKITIFYNVYGNSIFLCARGENQNEIQLCLPIDDRNVKQECRLAHILCGYLKCKFNIIKTVNFEYKSDYTNQKHAEDVVRAIRKEYDQL